MIFVESSKKTVDLGKTALCLIPNLFAGAICVVSKAGKELKESLTTKKTSGGKYKF